MNLVNPQRLKIILKGNVIESPKMMKSLLMFARNDFVMLDALEFKQQEELRYTIEMDLWKVLLPVIRIDPTIPRDGLVPTAEVIFHFYL